MPIITLPDGKTKSFDKPVTGLEVAASIGAGLAKAALAIKVDGELRDLDDAHRKIDRDCKVALITSPKAGQAPSDEALLLMRHSAAHVMAEAIQRIVPKAQLVYGPPLATGFYYDIKFPDDRPLRESDFAAIEAECAKIVAEDRKFCRYEMQTDPAFDKLKVEGNAFKADIAFRALAKLAPGIAAASDDDYLTIHVGAEQHRVRKDATISFYATGTPGQNWEDMCRGPHVPSTGRIGVIKVMSLASSYFHGDEKLARLTRVYGISFPTQAELDTYLKQREEAKARDHREIGKALRLFHIDETVGQGLILWTPAGSIVRKELQNFISAELRKQGYTEVFTPHIGSLELYKTSGHYPYYKDSQFAPIIERDTLDALSAGGCSCADMMRRVEGVSARLASGINERTKAQTIAPDRVMPDDQLIAGFMLRPMNCPHHAKIFDSAPHSYRDMPVRLAEFGTVYRWEQSGELNGMTRVRGFTQDDAHLFCTEDQIPAEIQGCLSLVKTIFAVLGMKEYRVRVGLRDPDSNKYTGSAESWDKAEAACIAAAKSLGVAFSKEPGEAAFYGPKIDFVVKDVIGREWQLGTVQVDYQMGNRFDLSYVGPDNKPHRPVVIHRAPFGSMERFIGVLIEHFAGAFPTWLAPEQVRVLPISDKSIDYARKVEAALRAAAIPSTSGGGSGGIRVSLDESNERIQGKIKVAAESKIPYLLIVGPRDAEQTAVSVRIRGEEKDAGAMPLDRFVAGISAEIADRRAGLSVRP